MFKTVGRRTTLAFLFAGLFLAAVTTADDASFVAHDGWLRPTPKSLDEAAVFVVIENHTAQRRWIVSGTSDIADKVELHQMQMIHMMMQMTPIPKIDIPPHGKVTFDPNFLHIMLFGLKRHPVEGDTIIVNLTLDDGTVVPFTAVVRKKWEGKCGNES